MAVFHPKVTLNAGRDTHLVVCLGGLKMQQDPSHNCVLWATPPELKTLTTYQTHCLKSPLIRVTLKDKIILPTF